MNYAHHQCRPSHPRKTRMRASPSSSSTPSFTSYSPTRQYRTSASLSLPLSNDARPPSLEPNTPFAREERSRGAAIMNQVELLCVSPVWSAGGGCICVTSLTNPHDDLPGDMKMFAQLIIGENIFLQTLLVTSEDNQTSWKLGFGCNIPPHAPTFTVAVLRQSETEGTRLVGYVEIRHDEALGSVESNRSFQLQLSKVNPDGPSFKFRAAFSVIEVPYQEGSGLDPIDMPENTISSVKGHEIRSGLQKLYEESRKPSFSMDALQSWVMHERILLCLPSNDSRAMCLNALGDFILQSYQVSGTLDDLNQAVCAYNDAVRDRPGHATYLADLGTSLLRRFERLKSPLDINQSIMMLETVIALTPDGHQDKPSRLNTLGESLLSRFEQLDDLDDLNQSVLRFEAAVALTPDGHPDKPSRLNDLVRSLLPRFQRLDDLEDLNQSILRCEAAVALTPDGHPYKPSRLNILGSILFTRFDRLGDLNDLNQSVLRFEAAVALIPDGDPDKPSCLNSLGESLLSRFEQLDDLDDLNQSVLRFEAAVALTPDGHPDKPSQLNDLARSLLPRFQRLGDLDDLNQSVLRWEAAVALTPDGHPHKALWLDNLGSSLFTRFNRLGDLDDLNQSVLRFEAAVALFPDSDPDKPSCLNSLGDSLLSRFGQLADLDDLNQSVLRFEAAVALTPDGHPDKPSQLNDLGSSLFTRFQRLGDLDDLNQSVLRWEAAIALTPDGHPDKPSWLNNLGNPLLKRFEKHGDLDDLNQSVLRFEAAVALSPDGQLLNNLGRSLFRRFERLGDLDDLNQSILRLEAAVSLTPEGHPNKPSWLINLGQSLFRRFERLDDLDDLNQSVLRCEAAVALTPDGHPYKPSRLNNLGNSLITRFQQRGDLNDLNQSALRFEAAVALTPDGDPNKPSLLNNLGSFLVRRFEQFGDLDDLNQSVLRCEAAVALTPDGHPDKPSWLNNLGSSLFTRFQRLGDLDDLNQSVLRCEAAVALTPDGHVDMPSRLNNLGNSLVTRSKRHGDLDDLNQSALRFEAAVALTPDGHSYKPLLLLNLGSSLIRRFERLGDLDDLNQSVLRLKAAVALIPDGHPGKPSGLVNLGNSLLTRFEQLHDPEDSKQLLIHYTSAACSETGPASARFEAARRWAKNAHIHQPSSVLHAYSTAIKLLPELAWLGLSITDRHHQLSQAGQVVRDAAAAAIAMQDYQKAVEWLEQGRSVIWGQLLNLRTPVDELRENYSGLADQLVSLSKLLETAGTRSNAVADGIKPQSLESSAEQSHDLAVKRNRVLQQIRALPGFERFLLSKPISELSQAAKMGPVAIVNISEYGCDALILLLDLAEEVIHVPLSNFTIHEAQAMAESLASIVGTSGRSDRLLGSREGDMAPDEIFSIILSGLWLKIVHPVLDALAITTPASQDLGRIWWCPTGPLAFLPIHAAGLYGENQAVGSKLSDFLISSYTPSLTALIEGYRPQSESQAGLQLLAVTQPSAEGQSYIPGTQEEIRCIEQHAKGKVPVLWLDEDMATIENVQKGMKESRWVHFACHGVQSPSPTESALLLAGSSRLTLSNIINLSLPNADLAFLSACQTATGSQELQDESVHLTAGMLLTGYRGVIGTMWSITDNDAPQVADNVYGHLLEVSPPDPTRAAAALHLAVRKLRERPGQKKSFLHWVPFIHFGV
ncbi:TPR-like protein [Mycena galericulata]|nr:TPR-like protein [Mycena galericulata]